MENSNSSAGTADDSSTQPIAHSSADIEANPMLCVRAGEIEIMSKEKCDCGKIAIWCLMSAGKDYGNPYCCDDCVHRGCSCNLRPSNDDYDNPDEWVQPKDKKGREYPCCEYDYSKEGYEIEE